MQASICLVGKADISRSPPVEDYLTTNSLQELRTIKEEYPTVSLESLGFKLRMDSEKRRAISRKLDAKIESALENLRTDFGYSTFMFFKSMVQTWLNREVTDEEDVELEDCPTVAAIQAQERRTRLRHVLEKLGNSCKILLHAGASQDASTKLRAFVHEAGTGAPRTIWRRGTRAIRSIVEGRLPSNVPDIVSILQVANAMRLVAPSSGLVCSTKE